MLESMVGSGSSSLRGRLLLTGNPLSGPNGNGQNTAAAALLDLSRDGELIWQNNNITSQYLSTSVKFAEISSDGKKIALATNDASAAMCLLDAETGAVVFKKSASQGSSLGGATVTKINQQSNAAYFAVAASQSTIFEKLDLFSGEVIFSTSIYGTSNRFRFFLTTPDDQLVYASSDSHLELRDAQTGALVDRLYTESDAIKKVIYSRNGNLVVVSNTGIREFSIADYSIVRSSIFDGYTDITLNPAGGYFARKPGGWTALDENFVQVTPISVTRDIYSPENPSFYAFYSKDFFMLPGKGGALDYPLRIWTPDEIGFLQYTAITTTSLEV